MFVSAIKQSRSDSLVMRSGPSRERQRHENRIEDQLRIYSGHGDALAKAGPDCELLSLVRCCIRFRFWCRFRPDLAESAKMGSFSKKLALLCLILTFWSALAFAYHNHSNTTEATQCNVCVVAHSASPKAAFVFTEAVLVKVSTFQATPVPTKQRLVAFALNVRPPPPVV